MCWFVFAGPLIRKYLLDNGHRVTVELRPDPALGDAIEAAEQERLAAVRAGMSEEELEAVVEATKVRERAWRRLLTVPGGPDSCCVCATQGRGGGNTRRRLALLRPHLHPLPPLSALARRCRQQVLKELQETPDAPEALTCIPSLNLSGACAGRARAGSCALACRCVCFRLAHASALS